MRPARPAGPPGCCGLARGGSLAGRGRTRVACSATPKRLSPTYFYDERGSQLFDEICELPEYYITRTETGILEQHAPISRPASDPMPCSWSSAAGRAPRRDCCSIALPRSCGLRSRGYLAHPLMAAAHRIADAYPDLEVLPACADFTRPFALPKSQRAPSRVVVFFPGSTIGNFDPPAAIELMKVMRAMVARLGSASASGGLVIGFDLQKDPAILERAYDDAAGVTAAFNLNVLRRLNRDLGASFDLRGLPPPGDLGPQASRIEMRLVSTERQTVTIAGELISFEADEPIITEHCHKYTPELFAAAGRGGRLDRTADLGGPEEVLPRSVS